MTQPLVSVIIPSFERFDYLQNAIESVNNQKYDNLEIIIINDCSKDSRYYSHNFQSNITKVDLDINQKSKIGFVSDGHIRNFGLKIAKGKYIATLDDDDYWLPNKLNLQVEKLENSTNKMCATEGLIGKGVYVENGEYELYNKERFYKKIAKKHRNNFFANINNFEFPDQFKFDFLKTHNSIIASSVLIEKELLDFIGGFRPIPTSNDYGPDYDCWLGLLRLTDCEYINLPLVYYDELHGDGREW